MANPIKKTIGFLGGSFDPAHKGHLKISKIAIKKLKLNKVLWVVTKQNPLKKKPFYSIAQRIERAKKLTKRIKKINVMHCVTDYPVENKYANLSAIENLRLNLKLDVGYSDHTLGILAPLIAVSKGAKIIGGCCEIGPQHIAEINKIREARN